MHAMHAGHMADALSGDDLVEIECRASAALAVAPAPWQAFLETRHATGGSTFIRVGDPDEPVDREMYVQVHVNGQVAVSAGGQVKVPTPRVDQLCLTPPVCRVRASRMR